jgi:hypothetical protein
MKHRNVATYRLHHGRSKKAILEIIADDAPGLFRIVWPDIGLSDRANLTRCKVAALEWAQHQKMARGRNLSVAQRLKSLSNFLWSGPYSDLKQPGVPAAHPESISRAAA